MKSHSNLLVTTILILLFLANAGMSNGETRPIDTASSVITIRVFKSGLFSMFAHDHLIQARGLKGKAATEGTASVEFNFSTRELKVADPGISDKERSEIQQAMEEKVLEVSKYTEIRFQSTSVSAQGAGRWQVSGNLSLHGRTHPVSFVVEENAGRYKGKTTLRQTDFGIEPITIAGGTIKVKDEIAIEFDVTLAAAH